MTVSPDLPQVLVIDDELGPRESLRMLLKPSYQVHTADSVEAGIDCCARNILMPSLPTSACLALTASMA